MAEPIKHPNQNLVLKAAPGDEAKVSSLSVCVTEHGMESVWQLTDDEVWDLIKSRKLILLVCTASAPPPVWVGVVKP